MAFNLTNTQVHVIPHQHQTSDIPGLVELIQANAVVVSPTAPENPNAGKLWYNTTKGVFNIWNGSSWILIGPEICPLTKAQYDALSTADKNDGRFYLITDNDGTIYVEWENIDGKPYYISSTAPSTPAEGNLWYDTTNDVLKVYDGTNWNPVNTYIEYVAGTNVQIDPSTHEISATDTTYTASDFDIKDLTDSTDLRTTWSGKQDAINDLSTIRSGAAAGATAVQPLDNVSGLTNDAGYITNSVNDLTNYYTKTQTYTKAEVDQMISDFGGFEVVEQLPAVATANPHIIYLLGPIGTGGDQYEEWIVTESCTGAFESESTINHESISYSTGAWGDIIWNSDSSVTNVYVGVNNAQFGDNTYMFIDDYGSSNSESEVNSGTTMPLIGMGGYMSSTPGLYEVPMVSLYGDNGVSFDLYYSDSELSWNPSAVCVKQWTKIGETSVDLSNYFNTFTDTADSITAGTNNLFVSPSEKSTWNAKQDTLVEGTGIDIDSNTNEISVDTTVVATQTDIVNFFDKTSDDADDIDDTNSTNKFVTASEKSTWNGKQDALTAGDNISIDSNTNTISADVNTKTFPMAFATKVDDAQAAIDWVLDGNNALIDYDNRIYLLDKVENGIYYFRGVNYTHNTTNDTIVTTDIEITVVSDEVTEVHIMGENHGFLETNRNYSTPFIPTQDGHPATKKYVDEHYTAGNGLTLSSGQFDVDTSIIATKTDLDNLSSFEVVQVLPSIAQADAKTIYILGPIGDGADKYEEWIVQDAVEGHFESASTIDHDFVEYNVGQVEYGDKVWNKNGAITNKYVAMDNLVINGDDHLDIGDENTSESIEYVEPGDMPYVYECQDDTHNKFLESPYISTYPNTYGSFDVYYSDSEITWVAGAPKQYVKIGETSPDLSGKQDKATSGSGAPSTTPTYVGQMYVDTTNNNLYVATGTSSSSDWTAVDTNTTYEAGTNIDITNNVISADTQFVVVDTLPSVAQADENKVYILGPIGDGADEYEEWIVVDHGEPHFVSESTIDHESIDFTYDGTNSRIWNGDDVIQNKYLGITNLQLSTSNREVVVTDYGGSCECCGVDNNSEMPFIGNGPSCDSTGGYEYPDIYYNTNNLGQPGETVSFDLYYSDTPLTWVIGGKQWTKIGETSSDLSNYLAKDNTTSYTPSGDYNPATKKYVDDRAVPTSGTTGYILTKTANGYEWAAAPSSGKYDIVTSATAPSDETVLWIKPGDGGATSDEMYRYDDANSDWVLMGGVHKGDTMPDADFGREGGFWLNENQSINEPELLYLDENAGGWVNVGGTFVSSSAPDYGYQFGKYGFWYDTSNNELKYYDYNCNNWISLWGIANTDYVSVSMPGNFFTTNSDHQVFYYENDFGWNPIGGIIYSDGYSVTIPEDKLWYDTNYNVFKYYNQSTNDWEEVTKIYTPGDGIDIDTSNNNEISVKVDNAYITTNGSGEITIDDRLVQKALQEGDGINIDAYEEISVDASDLVGNGLTTDGNNNLAIDTTVVATKSDLANMGSYEVVDTLPSASTADARKIYLLGPIGTGVDKYEEWIVTEDSQQQKQWTKIGETSIDLSGYATTSAMNTALATKANVSDLNTKTFYLTGTTGAENIAAAQEALDWYNAGKNPIIIYQDESYNLSPYEPNTLAFIANKLNTSEGASSSSIGFNTIIINYSGTTVSSITMGLTGNKSYLEANKNYATPYTPQYSGSPATKKYVDDNVVQKSSTEPSSPTEGMVWYDTTNDVLKVYDGTNWNEVGSGGAGDMLYADFNWATKTGASITLDLNSEIEPSSDFTVNAPATIKDGQIYVLRVTTGLVAYTMTLGTNITNPYNEDLTLDINTITQFSFVGIDDKLELQPSIAVPDISGKQDKATSGSGAPATTPSYIGQQYVDTTADKLYVATGTSASSDWSEVGSGSGDMLYQDFNWVTKTGATITLDLNSTITPSANFTVNAPATIKDGQIYILRVVNGATAYTMTLGTGITNPYSTSTTLTANYTDQFVFQSVGGSLELLPDTEVDITGKQDKATSGSTAPATAPSYVGQQYVDTTTIVPYIATGTTSADWQALPILSKQTGALPNIKIWVGTQSAYEALAPYYDSNTLYFTVSSS